MGVSLIIASVLAIILIVRRLDWLILRHLSGIPLDAKLRTLWTWIHEIWIQTDFVPLGETVLAWLALAGIVVGIALIVWPYWRAES